MRGWVHTWIFFTLFYYLSACQYHTAFTTRALFYYIVSLPARNVDVTSERDQLGMSWSRNPGHVAHRDDASQARGRRAAQAPCGTPLGALGTLNFSPVWARGPTSGSRLLLRALLSRVGLAVEEGPLAQTGGRRVVKWGPGMAGHLHTEKCSKAGGTQGQGGDSGSFS